MMLLVGLSVESFQSNREAAVVLFFTLVCLSICNLHTMLQQYTKHVHGAKLSSVTYLHRL